MKRTLIAMTLAALAGTVSAQATPSGLWKTLDDETNKEKSLVRLVDNAGTVSGRIEKLLDPARQEAKCDKCSDSRKDQPLIGMLIVEGAVKAADNEYWEGGTILDPVKGKTYKLRLTPKDGGKTLEVRGYIGPFFRNQTWTRVE